MSNEIFNGFAKKYGLDEKTRCAISNLILYHDFNINQIEDDKLEELVCIFGQDGTIMLFQLKRSDLLAQSEHYHYSLEIYDKQKEKYLAKLKMRM